MKEFLFRIALFFIFYVLFFSYAAFGWIKSSVFYVCCFEFHFNVFVYLFVFSFELQCCWSTRCYRRQMPVDLFRSLDFDICLVSFFFLAISLPPKCVCATLCVSIWYAYFIRTYNRKEEDTSDRLWVFYSLRTAVGYCVRELVSSYSVQIASQFSN